MITEALARQMAACLAEQREEHRQLRKYLAWMTGAVGVAGVGRRCIGGAL